MVSAPFPGDLGGGPLGLARDPLLYRLWSGVTHVVQVVTRDLGSKQLSRPSFLHTNARVPSADGQVSHGEYARPWLWLFTRGHRLDFVHRALGPYRHQA